LLKLLYGAYFRCIRDAHETTRHARRRLLAELVEKIDDVLEHIYHARPQLRPTEEDTEQSVVVSDTDAEAEDVASSETRHSEQNVVVVADDDADIEDLATGKTRQLIDRCYQVTASTHGGNGVDLTGLLGGNIKEDWGSPRS